MSFLHLIRTLCFLALFGRSILLAQAAVPVYQDATRSPADRASDLLTRMTWEEKVGQLGGVRQILQANLAFNETLFNSIHTLQNGMIGFGYSLNPVRQVIPIANRLRALQMNSTRLGIPYMTVTDSVNSIYLTGGTFFPATLSMSSSWNVPLFTQVVASIREESVACGVNWVLSPELDIARDPRYGRVGETYGEDTYLTSEFGTAYVKTMQEKDDKGFIKVATTIKHFIYAEPSGGVNTASQYGGLNHIYNDQAWAFIKVIQDAQPLSLMASYASIDRVPMSANKYMLQTILRQNMSFDGVIMSDALAILHLNTQSRVASSMDKAGLMALDAGLELELSPSQPAVFPLLASHGNDSQVVAQVNAAVTRLLKIKFMTGAFDKPLPTEQQLNATLRSPAHLEINRNISRESIVLLKNNGLLPLNINNLSSTTNATTKPTAKSTIALLGPFANIINPGTYAAANSTDKSYGHTLLDSLSALPNINLTYTPGVQILNTSDTSHFAAAVATANASSLAILSLGSLAVNGNDPLAQQRTDGEFLAHADIGLPGLQQQLLDAVLDTGVPTVLVLSGGQSFVLPNSTISRCGAIVHSFLGGEFTADAIVEILTGKVNPSGKLTVSVPEASGGTPVYYDYLPSDDQGGGYGYGTSAYAWPVGLGREVMWPFGFGLSYTSWKYSAPVISPASCSLGGSSSANSTFTLTTTLTNLGPLPGKEIVQVYFSQAFSSLTEVPVKKLIRFTKVELAVGESRNVTFSIPVKDLGHYVNTEWRVDEGLYTFWVGGSSRGVDLRGVNGTVVG